MFTIISASGEYQKLTMFFIYFVPYWSGHVVLLVITVPSSRSRSSVSISRPSLAYILLLPALMPAKRAIILCPVTVLTVGFLYSIIHNCSSLVDLA